MENTRKSLILEASLWAGIVAAVVVGFAVVVLRFTADSDKDAVRDYLKLTGIERFEEIEWFEPTEQDGHRLVRLKFREEVQPGKHVDKDYLFGVSDGLASVMSVDGGLPLMTPEDFHIEEMNRLALQQEGEPGTAQAPSALPECTVPAFTVPTNIEAVPASAPTRVARVKRLPSRPRRVAS